MKIIGFFMGLLVLALSFTPCADEAFSKNPVKIKIQNAESTSHQDNKHDDSCSPFCHCTCCAGFSINHSIIAAINPVLTVCKSFTSYLHANLVEISLPVWQPPQLLL